MLTTAPAGEFAVKQRLLSSDQTLATTIHAILLDKYGFEIYGWEPLTVALEVKDDFQVSMSSAVMDKWCAMQTLMSSDAFFRRIDAFLAICNSFADGAPYFDEFNPVTTEEAAWTIAEVGLNRDFLPVSNTIRQYLRTILRKDGFDDDNYPEIFAEIFEKRPSSADIRESIATLGNKTNIDRLILENMQDLKSQFDQMSDLKNVDNLTMRNGLIKALRINERTQNAQ